jgi:hypothetical protein
LIKFFSSNNLQQKAPALEPGPVAKGGNAAPHHRDSTIKGFRLFAAKLGEIHVNSLAMRSTLRRFSLSEVIVALVCWPS